MNVEKHCPIIKSNLYFFLQIQFVVILLFVFIIVPLSGCKTTKSGIYLDIIFAATFLAMFYNFYNKTYKPSKQANGAACKISNGSNGTQNGTHNNGEHKQNGANFKES